MHLTSWVAVVIARHKATCTMYIEKNRVIERVLQSIKYSDVILVTRSRRLARILTTHSVQVRVQ